jgi:cation/acetate symporter
LSVSCSACLSISPAKPNRPPAISAIAFATVLGTVSGLIVAASGAVAHDLMDNYIGVKMSDQQKVKAGKTAAVVVGMVAIGLGIAFQGMNVSILVGWAFAVAASANLPSIIMLLFWSKTTAKGIYPRRGSPPASRSGQHAMKVS